MENFVGIVIIALIVWGAFALESKNKKDKAAGSTTRSGVLRNLGVTGALTSFCTASDGNGQWLFWHEATNRMWYFAAFSSTPTAITHANLQSAELMIDGTSVAHASRPRQIGGALLGAAVAGPVGAVIGGLGAKSNTKEYVKRVDLRIVLNSGPSPLIDIPMAKAPGKGAKKGSFLYKHFDDEARQWHSYLTRILKGVQESLKSNEPGEMAHAGEDDDPKNQSEAESKIARLTELSELRNSGALTDEEFDSIKRSLLDS